VAVSSAALSWTLRMPAGTLQQWAFTFTIPEPATSPPYPLGGSFFEWVVRDTATGAGTPVIDITQSAAAAGQITVTSTPVLSQVLLTIYPAATVTLAPGTYDQSLWMNPGTTGAYSWVSGPLILIGNPQPQ
jgi:hypothetical protein